MPMHRTPSRSGRTWKLPTRLARLLLCLPLPLFLAATACQKDDDDLLRPGEVESNVVRAFYVAAEDFVGNEIKLDGDAKDKEWGGALDPGRGYTQVRMSADEGTGSPGVPTYVSIKAVYTDTDLFFLVRWSDLTVNDTKEVTYYVGPDLAEREGCQSILEAESSWIKDLGNGPEDEDRLVFAWEMSEAGDDLGTFRTHGCQIACHPGSSPQFGRPGYGRLDVWQWLACRTNPVRNLYDGFDNPNFPVYGTPGYLDDYICEPIAGLVPDPGRPCWYPNFTEGSARPRWVYRRADDPFFEPADPNSCINLFQEKCRQNNGLFTYYIWREDIERIPVDFEACDTENDAVLPQGRDPRPWKPGDAVGGYFYSYPTDSRDDVHGRAVHSDGVWTLEMGRKLSTGDRTYDVQFEGEPGERIIFTLALADNSQTRHWGSGPQILEFGPKSEGRSPSAIGASGE